MIGSQTKGRGFRGLLNYLEEKEKAERIGGNMSGRNPRELAAEFAISRQLNRDVERAVYHVSLSLPLHERLSDDTWNEVADKYLERMGFTDNQYVVYRHFDTDHDHIHIAASRIRLDDGKCVHDGWDYLRSEKVIRQLEKEYRLQPVKSSYEKLEKNTSTGQRKRIEREQAEYERGERDTPPELPIKVQLQKLIDRATTDQPTMPEFIARLQEQGVEVSHGTTRTGKSKGISYSWMGQHFSGTQLGSGYTFPGLQKHRGVRYEPERDDRAIAVAKLYPCEPSQKLLHDHDINTTIDSGTATYNEQRFDRAGGTDGNFYPISAQELAELIKDAGLDRSNELASENPVDGSLSEPPDHSEQQQLTQEVAPIIQRLIDAVEGERVTIGQFTAIGIGDLFNLYRTDDDQMQHIMSAQLKDGKWTALPTTSRLTSVDVQAIRDIDYWLGQLQQVTPDPVQQEVSSLELERHSPEVGELDSFDAMELKASCASTPKEMWQQYSQGLEELHPIQRDEVACCRALQKGHSEQATREMFQESSYYKFLQKHGEEKAERYALHVVAAAKYKNKMQQHSAEQKTKQRAHEQEHKRSRGLEL